jgi:hypothetical protein
MSVLRRVTCATVLSVVVAVAAGCGDDDASVFVELRTDFVPGVEFVEVRTTLGGGPSDPVEAERRTTAARGDDYLAAVRVAEVDGLTRGSKTVRIELLGRAGEMVASRRVRVELDRDLGIAVLITRTCADVSCPGDMDAPELTECLGGRCVAPECTLDDPAACGASSCQSDEDCFVSAACAMAACRFSACLSVPNPGGCALDEWCDPDVGCTRISSGPVDAGAMDSGGTDAATDARTDAATDARTDSGPPPLEPLEWSLGWSVLGAAGGTSGLRSIALDGADRVCVTGNFDRDIDFGGSSPLSRAFNGDDIVFACVRPGSTPVFQSALGGPGEDFGAALTRGPDGHLYHAGFFDGDTVDLGGGPRARAAGVRAHDVFVASHTRAGAHRWSIAMGGPGGDLGLGIAVGADGTVYAVGRTMGGFDPGDGAIPTLASEDVLVVALTASGVVRWSRTFGSSGFDQARGVVVVGDAVWVVGMAGGDLDLGEGITASGFGNSDAFVAVLDAASGAPRAIWPFGGAGGDGAEDLVVDAAGGLHLTGYFSSTIVVGTTTLVSAGGADALLIHLAPDGAVRGAWQFGGTGNDYASEADLGADGDLVFTGTFETTMDLGVTELTSAGANDIFVLALDRFHRVRGATRLGGAGADGAMSLAVTDDARVFVSGAIGGQVLLQELIP